MVFDSFRISSVTLTPSFVKLRMDLKVRMYYEAVSQ